MKNRNCQGSNKGLLSALVPQKPTVGKISNCDLIVVVDLCHNNIGVFDLVYHKLKCDKISTTNITCSDKIYQMERNFDTNLRSNIKNINVKYMNNFKGLPITTKGFQMKITGPDRIYLPYQEIKLPMCLVTNVPNHFSLVKRKRKSKAMMITKRLRNSYSNSKVYIMIERSKGVSYSDSLKEFFL